MVENCVQVDFGFGFLRNSRGFWCLVPPKLKMALLGELLKYVSYLTKLA